MAALLPKAPPGRRFVAWLYTGPVGHLWSTSLDIVVAWVRWGLGRVRRARKSGQ